MSSKSKRINLSFDLTREKDKKIYKIIMEQSAKTAFIIQKLIDLEQYEKQEMITKEDIKDAIKEVLEGMALKPNDVGTVNDENVAVVPDNIFTIFDKL